MTEADGQLAASATQRDRVALLFDSYLLTHGVEIILGSRVEGGGVWWNVTPLSSLFVLRLHTYLQTTASRYLPADLLGSFISTGSPLLFTLPWRLVATTVERPAVSQVLATKPHAGYLQQWKCWAVYVNKVIGYPPCRKISKMKSWFLVRSSTL
jgi:hypothetical protein